MYAYTSARRILESRAEFDLHCFHRRFSILIVWEKKPFLFLIVKIIINKNQKEKFLNWLLPRVWAPVHDTQIITSLIHVPILFICIYRKIQTSIFSIVFIRRVRLLVVAILRKKVISTFFFYNAFTSRITQNNFE